MIYICTVLAAGWNSHGQLGIGSKNDQHLPTSVEGVANVEAAACGRLHSLFLLNSESIACPSHSSRDPDGDNDECICEDGYKGKVQWDSKAAGYIGDCTACSGANEYLDERPSIDPFYLIGGSALNNNSPTKLFYFIKKDASINQNNSSSFFILS